MNLDDEVDGNTPTDTSRVAKGARKGKIWLAAAAAIALVAVIAIAANMRVGEGATIRAAFTPPGARLAAANPSPAALPNINLPDVKPPAAR